MCFSDNTSSFHIAGRHLDQTFLSNPHRPPDELLRWHFRQAVLANVKGTGEPWLDTELMDSDSSVEGDTGQCTPTGATSALQKE